MLYYIVIIITLGDIIIIDSCVILVLERLCSIQSVLLGSS